MAWRKPLRNVSVSLSSESSTTLAVYCFWKLKRFDFWSRWAQDFFEKTIMHPEWPWGNGCNSVNVPTSDLWQTSFRHAWFPFPYVTPWKIIVSIPNVFLNFFPEEFDVVFVFCSSPIMSVFIAWRSREPIRLLLAFDSVLILCDEWYWRIELQKMFKILAFYSCK